MPKDNIHETAQYCLYQLLYKAWQASHLGDRMANRTVAYLNCQIVHGGSFLESRARGTPFNIWWPLPTRRSAPNMNMHLCITLSEKKFPDIQQLLLFFEIFHRPRVTPCSIIYGPNYV